MLLEPAESPALHPDRCRCLSPCKSLCPPFAPDITSYDHTAQQYESVLAAYRIMAVSKLAPYVAARARWNLLARKVSEKAGFQEL